jgi:hypothetical protein
MAPLPGDAGSPWNAHRNDFGRKHAMITVGSINREDAAARFPFLGQRFRGRRSAIRELTHRDPDFVFWIFPDGLLHDARDSHMKNPPRGYEHIVNDEPDYGGFLRGRVATSDQDQIVVVYCRPEALAYPGEKVKQLARGLHQMPIPLSDEALVISDNGDIYGTFADVLSRAEPP